MITEGPMELRGGIFLINRGLDDLAPDLLGGTRVGRLEEVLQWKMGSNVHSGTKGNNTPTHARITGDWIEVSLTLSELTEEYLTLITNKRSSGLYFRPGAVGKYGHILRASEYNAIVIRDEKAPEDYPALYIPFVVCADNGWHASRGVEHTALANITLLSHDVGGAAGPVPFEYGAITSFLGYEEPEE
jgi:hypothetical protein